MGCGFGEQVEGVGMGRVIERGMKGSWYRGIRVFGCQRDGERGTFWLGLPSGWVCCGGIFSESVGGEDEVEGVRDEGRDGEYVSNIAPC